MDARAWRRMLFEGLIKAAQVLPDLTKLAICLLVSYFFSFFYYWKLSKVQSEWIKNLYIVSFANVFLFVAFSVTDIAQFYVPLIFTFTFVKLFRGKRCMPIINFVVTMTFLLCSHFYAKFVTNSGSDRYVYDITTPLMALIIKLTSFAFDMQDALACNSSCSSKARKTGPSKATEANRILDQQTQNKFKTLRHYPSFLSFLGYCLLFPGIFTFPTISFYKHQSFINGSLNVTTTATQSKDSSKARVKRIIYLFSSALFYLAVYSLVMVVAPLKYVMEAEFMSRPLLYRLLYVHLWSAMFRIQSYSAWMATEGSYVALGLGFRLDKDSGKPLWDELENINPLRTETFTDFRLYINEWNVSTQRWLREYVYQRIQNHYGERIGDDMKILVTYVVSGIWHGFHSGHQVMFIGWAWMTIIFRRMP